jgi:hypothetical protein
VLAVDPGLAQFKHRYATLSNISRTISKKNFINKINANLLDGDRENGVYEIRILSFEHYFDVTVH